jgi:hypothetical protein
MGSDDWRDDETLDPRRHIFSEGVADTFAPYVAVALQCDTASRGALRPRCLSTRHGMAYLVPNALYQVQFETMRDSAASGRLRWAELVGKVAKH